MKTSLSIVLLPNYFSRKRFEICFETPRLWNWWISAYFLFFYFHQPQQCPWKSSVTGLQPLFSSIKKCFPCWTSFCLRLRGRIFFKGLSTVLCLSFHLPLSLSLRRTDVLLRDPNVLQRLPELLRFTKARSFGCVFTSVAKLPMDLKI